MRADKVEPFDLPGLVLIGLGVGGLAFGLTVTGVRLVPTWVTVALVVGGAASTLAYVLLLAQHAGAGDRPLAVPARRLSAPAWPAASCSASAPARCRSFCRC